MLCRPASKDFGEMAWLEGMGDKVDESSVKIGEVSIHVGGIKLSRYCKKNPTNET